MADFVAFSIVLPFWLCGALAYHHSRVWPDGYNIMGRVTISCCWIALLGMHIGQWSASQPDPFAEKTDG